MGIFRQFPYSNFHEMNMDEIIKIIKNMLEEWARYYSEWDDWKDQVQHEWDQMVIYINNYFDNLDVQEEINTKISAMVNSGEFGEIVEPFIPDSVADWLADHITQPVGVVIDTSLTVSGACADAKATGDAIKVVRNYIKHTDVEFTSASNEYINTGVPIGSTVSLTPVGGPSNDWRYAIIDCLPGDIFEFSLQGGSASRAWAFIDSNNVLLSVANYSADPIIGEITAPANTSKAIFNDKSNGYASKSGLNDRVITLENDVTSLKNGGVNDGSITIEKTDFVQRVIELDKNIFNFRTMITPGHMFYRYNDSGTYRIHLVENAYTTMYGAICIPLYEFEDITISTDNNTASCYYYAFTNDNDEIITENDATFTINTSGTTLSVPSGATKFYFNWSAYELQKNSVKIMVSIGDTALPYANYGIYLTFDGTRFEPFNNANMTPWLNIPEKYELVIGDTFELFYKGIISAVNTDDLYVEIICAKGKAFKRKYVYTPIIGDTGTYIMTINLYDNSHQLLDSQIVNIVVKAKTTSPLTEKVVLYVSDSLAVSGDVPHEFKRRLTGTGGTPAADGLTNITFIGTCEVDGAKFEGYGGYNFNAYNTEHALSSFMWITCENNGKTIADQHSIYLASNGTQWSLETIESDRIKIICTDISGALPGSTGTLTWVSGGTDHNNIVYTSAEQAPGNPFWNSVSESVDFASYVTAQGETSLDYVYVLLGWNSVYENSDTYKTQVETFITNVLTDFPSCKIILLGLEVPAYDGLANNYGSSNVNDEYYNQLSHVWKCNNIYKEIADENPTNVSFVNIAGQFDTKYNMPTGTTQVNTRNTETVTYQINGVHPAQSGYFQIADACYRDFVHKLS